MPKPGIWLMEGYWSSSVSDVRSVKPMLQALSDSGIATFVHRHINDAEDLVKAMTLLGQKRQKKYDIAYLACHGEPGIVHIGDDAWTLTELADELPSTGALEGKLLHFGSCSVLRNQRECRVLLKATGARAISGFTKDVDWFEPMAFELLMFQKYARYKRFGSFVNGIERDYGQLGDKLGFTIISE